MSPRFVHYVLKIGERKRNIDFFTKVLQMTVLRHEEFSEGCQATCNGPYDGRWSKTMVGYGDENTHFVLELTYNYGVSQYALGNSLLSIVVACGENVAACICDSARHNSTHVHHVSDSVIKLLSPDGYPFVVRTDPEYLSDSTIIEEVRVATGSCTRFAEFWGAAGHLVDTSSSSHSAEEVPQLSCRVLGDGVCVRATQLREPVRRADSFGRLAVACPAQGLQALEERVQAAGFRVLTPCRRLDTPGKATVTVLIVADGDGHEVCFVGEEAFQQLCATDPDALQLLMEAIGSDKSR